jgi:hypothetical protein
MKNTKVKRFSTVLALSMMLGGGVLGLGLPAGTVTHSSAATVRSAHHLRGPHSLLDLRRRRPNARWANIADVFSHLLSLEPGLFGRSRRPVGCQPSVACVKQVSHAWLDP